MAEEEGDDRSRLGRRREWRERVNSHVTGPCCSVDGKRKKKYNNLKKRADRCVFHQIPLCHIYRTADRPDNSFLTGV